MMDDLEMATTNVLACAYNAAVNYGSGRANKKMWALIRAINHMERIEGRKKLEALVEQGVIDSFTSCPPECVIKPGGLFHAKDCENESNHPVYRERQQRARELLPGGTSGSAGWYARFRESRGLMAIRRFKKPRANERPVQTVAMWTEDCRECNGIGVGEDHMGCPTCHGTGTVQRRENVITIKRDFVKALPEGSYVALVFRVDGYEPDVDGSALTRLEHVDAAGKSTGAALRHMGLYPDTVVVLDAPSDLHDRTE